MATASQKIMLERKKLTVTTCKCEPINQSYKTGIIRTKGSSDKSGMSQKYMYILEMSA